MPRDRRRGGRQRVREVVRRDVQADRGTLDGGALTLDPATDVDANGSGRLTLTVNFPPTAGDPAGAYRVDPFFREKYRISLQK